MTTKYTKGPWTVNGGDDVWIGNRTCVHIGDEDDARLIAAAPTQHEEMLRYLPIIERAEADPELWERLAEGTGIATANGYRAAIAKATGEQE